MERLNGISLAIMITVTALATPVFGQSGGAGGDRLQQLLDELKVQLDRAEKERLADPWFLRDLRNVVGKYDYPWRRQILFDEFSGSGPQPGPPWQVTAGEFLIDWRHGLRSVVRPAAKPQTQEQQPQQPTQKSGEGKLAKQLLGTILQQAIGPKPQGQTESQGGGQQQTTGPAQPAFAAVIAPVTISNAFAVDVQLTSRPMDGLVDGRLEFGPYQGTDESAGYRLAYIPDAPAGSASLELLRLSSTGGIATLELYPNPVNLADGQVHTLLWTRDSAGAMAVKLDGQELIRVTDRSFRDPFSGFAIVNSGGDYAIRSIKIDGTE